MEKNNNNRFKQTMLTMVAAFFNTIAVSIFNLVYNRYLLLNYGSDYNGLLSTLMQFVSFFTVLESGFFVVAVVASYKPLQDKDYRQLNNILFTVKKYFDTITFVFLIMTLILGSGYVLLLEPIMPRYKMLLLLFITIITSAVSMNYISRYSIVLSGDNKAYVKSIIIFIAKALTWLISLFFIIKGFDIVLVFSFTLVNAVLGAFILRSYEKKKYPFVSYKDGIIQTSIINETKHVLSQKIASTIFSSTDLLLVSVAVGLKYSSVYMIYNQIFQAVFGLIVSLVESPANSLGQMMAEKYESSIKNIFDVFSKTTEIFSTIVLSTVGMSIIPFMRLYSYGINDTNYILPFLVLLFFSQFYWQINNKPYGVLLNSAGKFSSQNLQCWIAAVVNIIISILGIQFWGMYGVIVGSIIGMMVILIGNIISCKKNFYFVNAQKSLIIIVGNYSLGIVMIITSNNVTFFISKYVYWLLLSCVELIISMAFVLSFNVLFDNERTISVLKYWINKIVRKKSSKAVN